MIRSCGVAEAKNPMANAPDQKSSRIHSPEQGLVVDESVEAQLASTRARPVEEQGKPVEKYLVEQGLTQKAQ